MISYRKCISQFISKVTMLLVSMSIHTDDQSHLPCKKSAKGDPPHGLPPDRDIELVLETGRWPMPRISEGENAEFRRQLVDFLDWGWIHPLTAGHAASMVS